jgi:prepilin-type N-terminal cleavage/methylation domain-containing protein
MKRIQNTQGFTLIELLVVVAIIGILAAIAIPQFAAYRQKGYDAQANTDLRNAATSEEAYFATYQTYLTCANLTACKAALPGFTGSAKTVIAMAGTATTFTGSASSTAGSASKVFSYDSTNGGMQ